MDSSYVAVQGPPGTGKTYVGARVIKKLVEDHHWRVGVVAQSHAVVENLLNEIVDAGLSSHFVGKSKPSDETPSWSVIKDNGPARAQFVRDSESSGCVLGGTAWTFCSTPLLDTGPLDLLVIDEAGQFALAPTLAVSRAAHRLLLLGDPQQLPQVSQGTHPEPIDQSALAWLLGDHDTVPASHGYFLPTSRRMHPAVCGAVSDLSYEGRLTAHQEASERSLGTLEPGVRVLNVDHRDNRTSSSEEAEAITAQIRQLLGTPWVDSSSSPPRPLEPKDFLVVAPYNAQVQLIQGTLIDGGIRGVRVGTVDKFQGQQAPVAFVSMTASSREDVPRGMGFLLNRNRINVAVSRAKWLAIVVRSPALTTYMPATVDELLDLGAFQAMCEGQTAP